jgi:hypothetical protein
MQSTSCRASALLFALLLPVLAQAQATLSMAEVKTLITDKTVDIHNLSTGLPFRAYHAASGEMIVQRADAMEFSGRWSVRADGAHCVYFDVESCGSLSKNAFTWLKVTPGKDF